MPELPEVENVKIFLQKNVENLEIKNIFFHSNKILKNVSELDFKKSLINEKIIKVDRFAKYLIFYTTNMVIVSHLRMEGKYYSFLLEELDLAREKIKHAIFEVYLSNNKVLLYGDTRKFGTIHLYKKNDFSTDNQLSHVADEPFTINENDFFKKISKRKTAIKKIIIDQSIISGIGNIYADEILFSSKINPLRLGISITKDESDKILRESVTILKKAIKMKGTTIRTFYFDNFFKGEYQKELKVYSRYGEKCLTCNDDLKKVKIGGRTTVYCSKCQK